MDNKVKMKISFEFDPEPESPLKSWFFVGTMVYGHRRYILGHEEAKNTNLYSSWDEWLENELIQKKGELVYLPLYLYDHSGLTISTEPFACPWDSGQVGYIYVEVDDEKVQGLSVNEIEKILKAEVALYDLYLIGEVLSFNIYEGEDEDLTNRCGSIYDSSYESLSLLVIEELMNCHGLSKKESEQILVQSNIRDYAT